VVLELSSFQLHTMTQSPHTAVVTNLSPNHLDVHKSIEEYIDAKKNIFKYQRKEDRVVLNYDNDITRGFAAEAPGKVIPFSRLRTLKNGAFLQDGKLVYTDGTSLWEIVEKEEIMLPGDHNIENYLAAIAATIDYVKPEDIRGVAVSFKGVEHRMELVRVVNGVSFYNDSIGTSPARTIAGLNAFKQKVILIAGGYEKNIPYDGMGEVLVKKVKHLVLIGPTGPKIAEALNCEMKRIGDDTKIPVTFCGTFEETVKSAVENAAVGDIVLLSPASASFDLFRDFEERGNRFKELVMAIPENK
jgi:UDP-N-acetylmuramoylalanine--D-glutamate ligase